MKYGSLSHEQARFYRDQGYYRLTGVFSPEQTTEMRAFIQNEATKLSDTTDPSNPNKKLYGAHYFME